MSTIQGDIVCTATITVAGIKLSGFTNALAPSVGGITNVGTFQLKGPNDVKIATGAGHTCGLTAQGGVKCWGQNVRGELGDGTLSDRPLPKPVVGLANGVIDIAAGDYHTCAVIAAGAVKCWGNNQTGQLGDGTTNASAIPRNVFGLTSGVVSVTAGRAHTCALMSAGGVKCWGSGFWGQLGAGQSDTVTPVDIVGLGGSAKHISAGAFNNCVLLASGEVKCWGNIFTHDGTLKTITGLSRDVVSVSAGDAHNCVLLNSGAAKCWGDNTFGQLGDGSRISREAPRDATGLSSGVVAVDARHSSSCAILSTGAVKCWGENPVGNGTPRPFAGTATPTDVPGLSDGVSIGIGAAHTCVRLNSGAIKCWGSNEFGELGDGSENVGLTPKDVVGF